jgi:hypothetical protein
MDPSANVDGSGEMDRLAPDAKFVPFWESRAPLTSDHSPLTPGLRRQCPSPGKFLVGLALDFTSYRVCERASIS